jgi:hypothetical protein
MLNAAQADVLPTEGPPAAARSAKIGAAEPGKSAASTQATPDRSADRVRALVPAFAGLVMLSIALLVLTWYGARVIRRRTRKVLRPTHPVGDEWSSKPLTTQPGRPTEPRPPQGA